MRAGDVMSNAASCGLLTRLIAQNLLFIGIALWWMRRSGRTFASIGLAYPTRRQVLTGIGGGIAVAIVGYGFGEVETWLLRALLAPPAFQRLQRFTDAYGAEHAFLQLPAFWMMAVFALIGSLLSPVAEEMLFRGVVFHSLQERWRLGTRSAIVGSSLLFALAHVSPLALLPLFLMGMAFAAVYARTGSLWVPISMHAANNAVSFALLVWMNTGIRH